MAEGKRTGGGEGLSLQTLVVAAAASAVAAVVVSHLWKDGTVFAAAMTPVIVAITKEMLTRPMESELVRKPVQQVGRLASGRIVVPGRAGARGASEEARVLPPIEEHPSGPANGDGRGATGAEFTPIRTYDTGRRRRPHLKVALITGLIAFVIAAAALTLPELIFGGAISSHHSTTLFGGGGGRQSKSSKSNHQQSTTSTQPQQSKQQNPQTTPAAPAPSGGTSKPSQTTPQSTTPQSSPRQTTPQGTSPVPTTPTPPAP